MDGSKVAVNISAKSKEKIEKCAKSYGLSADKLIEVIFDDFIDSGGKLYVGKWKEGPGMRLLVDWPRFSSGVLKIKEPI